jgi:hypothetical protein
MSDRHQPLWLWLLHRNIADYSHPPLFQLRSQKLPEVKPCFESNARRPSEPLGLTQILVNVSGSNSTCVVNILTARRLPAKRQRVADGAKILLDIAKESSDWFPPLKSALGGVGALIKHYEVWIKRVAVARDLHVCSQEFKDIRENIEDLIPHLKRFKQYANAAIFDGDQAEKKRRSELSRYARRLLATHALVDGLRSALKEIEKRSRDLLAKGTVARFADKDADSREVARLVERLREAIIHYQVSENCFFASSIPHVGGQISQQQEIYDKIINLTVRIPACLSPLHG